MPHRACLAFGSAMFRACGVLMGIGLFFLGPPAGAEVRTETDHSKARTYSAALRYLRIDLGYEVTEQDPGAAYLLFQFKHGRSKKVLHGSVEIIDTDDDVRVLTRIPALPEYEERRVSDGLMAKLRRDYGDAAKRRPRKPPKDDREPKKDGGDGDAAPPDSVSPESQPETLD